MTLQSGTIHHSAIIHPDAELGDGVVVGPGCIIEEKTVIGDRCIIDAYAQVKKHTRMGKENHLHSYSVIGGEPQDLKFHGEESELVIGDRNVIREYVTIHRGTENGGGLTAIGSGCLLMTYVHIAHDCKLGDGVIFSNLVQLAGHVEVGHSAVIGGMSAVHQFVRLGASSFLGGMSGMTMDLPPYMLASGNHAKVFGPNLIGLRRRNFPKETISALRSLYKLYWRSEKARAEAVQEAEETLGEVAEVKEVLDFIKSSERGVAPAPSKAEREQGAV